MTCQTDGKPFQPTDCITVVPARVLERDKRGQLERLEQVDAAELTGGQFGGYEVAVLDGSP